MMLYGTEAMALVIGGVAAEARHAVLKEGALTLEDYWVRRSARARFDLDSGLAALQPAADAMAPSARLVAAEASRQIDAVPGAAQSRNARRSEMPMTRRRLRRLR